MRPETRHRVLDAATEMGYDFGRLRAGATAFRAVVVFCPSDPHPNVPMLYRLVMELGERLSHHGFRMLLESGHGPSAAPKTARELFGRGGAEGAIVVSMAHWADDMRSWGIPCVLLGPGPEESDPCHVSVDDELGGRLAAEHLWALGHRHVGLIHMWGGRWASRREWGFRAAMDANGHALPSWAVQTLAAPTEAALEATIAAMLEAAKAHGLGLTGLFCDADWVAAHAVRILRASGVEVPRAMSVVGFDDAHFASMVDPPLTSVRQPFAELAALAASLLVEQLAAGARILRSYSLPCELIVRRSSGPVGGDRAV